MTDVEYRRLRERRPASSGTAEESGLPPLPGKMPSGSYPAVGYARALAARDVTRSRRRLGLSQSELARRAGVRVETLDRIERAKMTASPRVMEKLDAVLNRGPRRRKDAGNAPGGRGRPAAR